MSKTNKKSTFLRIGELADKAGLRYSTIKYYSEIGILPFEQNGERLGRRFEKDKSLKRLKEIDFLIKEERRTIKEIVEHFKKK